MLVIAVPSLASAQTTGAGYADALTPSLASVAGKMHATIRRDLAEAAESMPADEYSFRPAPEVRSFAQLIGHVINANWFFCSQAKQEKSPSSTNNEQLTDKAALVKALNDSLAYCDQVYTATTDANFNAPVHMAGGVGMGPADTVRGALDVDCRRRPRQSDTELVSLRSTRATHRGREEFHSGGVAVTHRGDGRADGAPLPGHPRYFVT
ncbi:MAG TPA: DinB family protein [Vicinamibacterales bacterium]|jgi:hypothetical protein